MKHDAFLKRYISFILAAFIFMYSGAACLPVNGEEGLYDKILRLHVIANSDSDSDQEMKLFVRDAVLCELESLYRENSVESLEEAKSVIKNNRERLAASAESAVISYSPECNYDVELELCEEYYPTKNYEEVSLPAGRYNSLKIKIGRAAGQNWWCVLFPSLCLASATKKEDTGSAYVYEENGEKFIAAGFTPEEIRIISDSESDEVKIKFRVLEIFGSLFDSET